MMLQAIVEGFGGVHKEEPKEIDVSSEAFKAMQDSALAAIAQKAGSRLPMVRGRDKNLPKAPPVFDIEELRRRNESLIARKVT